MFLLKVFILLIFGWSSYAQSALAIHYEQDMVETFDSVLGLTFADFCQFHEATRIEIVTEHSTLAVIFQPKFCEIQNFDPAANLSIFLAIYQKLKDLPNNESICSTTHEIHIGGLYFNLEEQRSIVASDIETFLLFPETRIFHLTHQRSCCSLRRRRIKTFLLILVILIFCTVLIEMGLSLN